MNIFKFFLGTLVVLLLSISLGCAETSNDGNSEDPPTTTPPAPTISVGTVTGTDATLSWTAISLTGIITNTGAAATNANISIQAYYLASTNAPADAATLVKNGTAFGVASDGSATSITLTGLTAVTQYYAVLKLINLTDTQKVSYSNVINFTTTTNLNTLTFNNYENFASISGLSFSTLGPSWASGVTSADGTQVTYTITKTADGSAAPAGITIHPNTGIITVGTTAAVASETGYTITATAKSAFSYTGTHTSTINIKVLAKPTTINNFIKLNGANGKPLYEQTATYNEATGTAAAGTKWGCAYDFQGLVWEIKTDDGGTRDKDNKYQWGGTGAVGRNDANKQGTYYTDWNALVNAANTENTTGLCGFTDWRVPKLIELNSIANITTFNPSITTSVFPNTVSGHYWSAIPNDNRSTDAWAVVFSYGYDGYSTRTSTYNVRLVRGGSQTVSEIEAVYIVNDSPDDRYTVHSNGTVTDKKTGLMWKQCSEGLSDSTCSTRTASTYTYANALLRNNTTFATYSDWRMPTKYELKTLTALDRSPAINSTVFPNTDSAVYWSASPNANDSNFAWAVDFNDGFGYYYTRTDTYFVRLVRGTLQY